MTGRGILKFIAITFTVLIAAVLLVLWLFDFGRLKPTIETAVSDATGRAFHINGTFSLRVLPAPHLLLEDVTLASPGWSKQPQMLSVGKMEVGIHLSSLLSDPVVIDSIELKNVAMRVETNDKGLLNWDFSNGAKPEKTAEPAPLDQIKIPLVVHNLDIANIALTYLQPGAKKQQFQIESLSASPHAEGGVGVQGKGKALDKVFSLAGRLTEQHTTLDVNVEKLKLATRFDYPDDALDFKLDLDNLATLGKLIKVDQLPAQTLKLQGNVALVGNDIVFKKVDANVQDVQLTVDGRFATATSALQATVQLAGDKLSTLASTLPALSYSMQADVKLADTGLAVAPFEMKLGDSLITGKANVGKGEHPPITLELASKELDLKPFMASSEPPADAKAEPKAEPAQSDKPAPQFVFTKDPLPFDQLKSLDLKVNAAITRLVLPARQLHDVELDTTSKKGKLDLKTRFKDPLGGQMHTELALDASHTNALLKLNTHMQDFKFMALSGEGVEEKDVPLTRIDIKLDSSGNSARALASNLNGIVVLDQGEGIVNNAVMGRVSNDILAQLIGALNPFAKQDPLTRWDCSVIAVKFVSGKGSVDGMLMESEKLLIVGNGEVDLNTEELDFEFNTKPRQGVGVSADMFVTPFVRLVGTLAKPSVGLNKTGVLLSGGAAVLTGGMSFLYTGVVDRVMAEGSKCEKARAALSDLETASQ